jgi:alkanesulfonate monooxygenase SsuD/methylene tetrahydromethanopterin reductase-like flavin-dependent oxidoreductase (luciferase family)
MRLGYFTMPVHPLTRDWSQTLREDREAIILADRLGFYDAFVGEHLTDACENVTNSMLFQATLISDTKTIKLATGTTNLSQMHPVLIAQNAAMFDHLSQGRFIFGISPGALSSDAEALGLLEEDRNKIFAEAIDVILAIWEREPPYDIDLPNNRFKVAINRNAALHLGVGIFGKPFQKPRPEIVGTVVAPFSPGCVLMGKRDFHPLSANFLLAKHLKSHWQNFAKGKAEVGQKADINDWRIARTIFVADDEATARSMCSRATRNSRTKRSPTISSWTIASSAARSTRWSTPSWRCARRPAISGNWSMPAWTLSIRRWPSAR